MTTTADWAEGWAAIEERWWLQVESAHLLAMALEDSESAAAEFDEAEDALFAALHAYQEAKALTVDTWQTLLSAVSLHERRRKNV